MHGRHGPVCRSRSCHVPLHAGRHKPADAGSPSSELWRCWSIAFRNSAMTRKPKIHGYDKQLHSLRYSYAAPSPCCLSADPTDTSPQPHGSLPISGIWLALLALDLCLSATDEPSRPFDSIYGLARCNSDHAVMCGIFDIEKPEKRGGK